MRKIYKYPLKPEDKQIVKMPRESTLLSVGIQTKNGGFTDDIIYSEQIVLWAMIDMQQSTEELIIRTIHIIGTGNPIPEVQLKFIDTVQMHNGFVWHIFEEL